MRFIFQFFVSNWRFSFVLTLMMVLAGLLGLFSLQRESFPPVSFATVTVSTVYPGASPEEVEERVTDSIEDEIRGIDGIKDVRSTSQPERSQISIRVDIDRKDSAQIITNIQRAVQRASAKLPAEILEAPRVLEINAKEIPVIEVAVIGSNQGRLRDREAKALQKKMEDINGVSSVRLTGYREREIQVLLDTKKMSQNYIGLTEVTQAIGATSKNIPAGYLRNSKNIQLVRVLGQDREAADIANIVIRSNFSRQVIRVKDVAEVIETSEEAKVLARFNSQPATLVIATKKADMDAYSVVNGIRSSVEDFKKSLPSGLEIFVYNDEGLRIANRLKIVNNNGLGGMAIVLIVLFLFLPGKIGLMSAMSLPICVAGTVAFMVYSGATFNIITMLALIICLGNLVDNSVVVSEHYTRLREEGIDAQEAAIRSAEQFWVPFTASTITIIAAFIPMLVTKGVLGQFIQWIPIVVTGALIVSLIESLTVLPARLQFIHPRNKSTEQGKKGGWFASIEKGFEKMIDRALHWKLVTGLALTALIISGFVVTFMFNRFELFPAEGVEFYVTRIEAPVGTNVQTTDQAVADVAAQIATTLGPDVIKAIVGRAGVQQAGVGDPQAKNGENVGFILVAIKPEIAEFLNINDTLSKLRTISKPAALSELTFEQIQGGPPVGKPLTVTLRSPDYKQLRSFADIVREAAAKTKGAFAVKDDELSTGDEWAFRPDSVATRALGLNVDGIGLSLRNALQGISASRFNEANEEVDILIRLKDEEREGLSDLRKLKVFSNTGKLIPLEAVGQLDEVSGPTVRKHYNFRRSITVSAEVDPTQITSQQLNQEIRKLVTERQKDFSAVTVTFGGEEESTKESLQSLAIALILAILGIFATLVFTFRSFLKPLLILSSIPLGLIGVCYAFALDQRPLSFLAFIGVIGLSGVVINSAIILVDYIEELRRKLGHEKTLQEILVMASGRRLRAVLATGLTTVVGIVPTAFSLGGYDPILVPMTLALSWGMIVGTFLSLFWIPIGYVWLDGFKRGIQRLFRVKDTGADLK